MKKLKNPAVKFVEFKNGQFQYWDKNKSEVVEVKLPIRLTVLDTLSKVSGWSDKHGAKIISNEVRAIWEDTLELCVYEKQPSGKSKRTVLIKGIYHNDHQKAEILSTGAKFVSSVYAVMDKELVNFSFKGAVLSEWLKGSQDGTFEVKKIEDRKKGSVDYKVPIFEAVDGEKIDQKLAAGLAIYLDQYFNGSKEEEEKEVVEDDGVPF